VFTPVRPSPLDTKQAAKIRAEINEKRERHDFLSDLELTMVVLSQVSSQTKAGRYFLDQFRGRSPSNCRPFLFGIHRPSSTRNWSARRCSHTTPTSRAPRRRDQYRQNTAELVRRLGTPDWKDGVEGVDAEQASGPVAGSEEVAR